MYAHIHVRTCTTMNMWMNEVRVTSFAEPNTLGVIINWNVICDEPRYGHTPCVTDQSSKTWCAGNLFETRWMEERLCAKCAQWLHIHTKRLSYSKTHEHENCEFKFLRHLKHCLWEDMLPRGMLDGYWGHHIYHFLKNQNRKYRVKNSIPSQNMYAYEAVQHIGIGIRTPQTL